MDSGRYDAAADLVNKVRGDRPFLFTNIRSGENVDQVIAWIKKNVLLEGL